MTLSRLAPALAFHAARTLGATLAVTGLGAAAAMFLAVGGGTGARGPGSAVVLGSLGLALTHLGGSVGREAQEGRAVLWAVAAGHPLRYLLLDLGMRFLTLLLTATGFGLAAGVALEMVRPGLGSAVARAAPGLAALVVSAGAVTAGCSGLLSRHDTLAVLAYLVPLSLMAPALTVAAGHDPGAWAVLLYPWEALGAMAASAAPPLAWARVLGFTVAWAVVALAVGWFRTRRPPPRRTG